MNTQKKIVAIYAGIMRTNLFFAYDFRLQSRRKKLDVTRNPVMVKKAFTAVPPSRGSNWSFPVNTQKCEIISIVAKKKRRKSKQLSLRIS